MKKILSFILVSVVLLSFTGCGGNAKTGEIYNEDISISGYIGDGVYLDVNKAMNCCDEYYETKPYVEKIKNASSWQLYNVTMHNDEGEEIQPAGEIHVKLDVPEAISNMPGDNYKIYQFKDNKLEEVKFEKTNGVIEFDTDFTGIYVFVKTSEFSNFMDLTYAITTCDGSCDGCTE